MPVSFFISALIELGPNIALFIAGRLSDFKVATIIFLITAAFAFVISIILQGRIPFLPVIYLFLIGFGVGINIIFEIETAVIISASLFSFVVAGLILQGLLRGKDFLQQVFGNLFAIKPQGWRILSYRWMTFMFLLGCVNEYVRLSFSPEAWINFNLGVVIVTSLFGLYQFRVKRKHRIKDQSSRWGFRIQ